MSIDGDLILTVGGRSISGWTEIQVSRSIERCPSHFDVGLTELYPGEAGDLVVQPGDACQVTIGGDLVITGYVDRFAPSITKAGHTIRITGRSKSQDLVDCAAEWPNGQISSSSVLSIAQKLAQPYGISVSASADVGDPIPQFNLMLGETAYAIIERICRYRGLLAYDQPDGSLLLAQAGSDSMASGLTQGQNIQVAAATYSVDQRFSEYQALLQSMDRLGDTGDGGNLLSTATDPGVKRHRRMVIITEAGGGGADVAKQRATWEAARRAGRGNQITATVDSWRDQAGKLWAPNAVIPLGIPVLKLPSSITWVIGEVSYKRANDTGTTADLLIMPQAAFNPEPILLQPFPADVPANPGGAPQ